MKVLSLEQRALLELLKIEAGVSSDDFDFTALTDENWHNVMKQSRSQAVALLCFDAFGKKKVTLPDEVYAEWLAYAVKIIRSNESVFAAQEELVALLEKERIDYIILKGASSAEYYPEPIKRTFGDVDFLVSDEHYQKTKDLLCANGYEPGGEDHKYHLNFQKDRVHLELHREIAGIPENAFAEDIRQFLDAEFKESLTLKAGDFKRPNDALHGLVILLHTLHHLLMGGIGIRHLCDIACFQNKTAQSEEVAERLVPLLKETGLLRFASALYTTCSIYLGAKRPDWCLKVSDEFCFSIISAFLGSGNLGKQGKPKRAEALFFSEEGRKTGAFGKLRVLAKKLHTSNMEMYPVIRKFPPIYPFISVWRATKYFFNILMGKRATVGEAIKYANRKGEFLSRFELYKKD